MPESAAATPQRPVDEAGKREKFAAFIAAYGRMRDPDSLLAELHESFNTLHACMPDDGRTPAQTITLLERMCAGEMAAWAEVLLHAIDIGLDAETFADLKRICRPPPCSLLAVRRVDRDGQIVLSGPDAEASWKSLLESRHANRTFDLSEGKRLILIEAHE